MGAAGAIVHRNPRSAQWNYSRLVEEVEIAYGPSSEHAAAVAIELRQRVRKPGESLHLLRDDIYEKVSVAYSDRTERKQDGIGVEVFTHAIGDTEIVQKLLEKRPLTLAQAYDIARRYETTKRAASHVTSLTHAGVHGLSERKPRTAVVREGVERGEAEVVGTTPAMGFKQTVPERQRMLASWRGYKDIKWEEIRCHNCTGIGHMKRNCPSPRKATRGQSSAVAHNSSEPTAIHFKTQSIHLTFHGLDICAVLDSGARKSVLPLQLYDAIHPDTRTPLQPSVVKTLLGVGPGDIPVIGEVYVPVQINNRQVNVHFLVADVASEEALLGHPFLAHAQARLDFRSNCITLFGEEVPYFQVMGTSKTRGVRVARTVVVEAGLEYVVRGNTHLKDHIKGEVMLSPTRGFVEKYKVLVARVLVEAQPFKGVPLRIFNPGNTAVTIRRGAIAGFLQPAEALEPANTTASAQMSGQPTIPQHLQELYEQSATELNPDEQLQLSQLLRTYGSLFSTGPGDLGRTSLVQHDIMTQSGAAVKQPPRRMAREKQQDADKQVKQSLEVGLARRSLTHSDGT